MANAGKHGMHPGAQGKGTGSGAMTNLPEGVLGENEVLSNRDKAQHDDERGLDSKAVQTEQYQDHSANHTGTDEGSDPTEDNASGMSNPMTDTSGGGSSPDEKSRG
jgi:hypothetical protein